MNDTLIKALQNPALYPHPVTHFQVLETHISWVLLTGPYVYKIKKPVNFGFLDFSTLEARKYYCEKELQLNGRLTSDLYLEVLPITGTPQAPSLIGEGPVIEYALKMAQFPQEQMLNELHNRHELTEEHIDQLTWQISHFHQNAEPTQGQSREQLLESIIGPVTQNFEQIRPLLSEPQDLEQLEQLSQWAESTYQRLLPQMEQRIDKGFIRDCHGDIHLGNAAVINGHVTLFDCVEFNESFRNTDTISDVAFLAMDLEQRSLKSFANHFVNNWLEQTGDYEALPLLPFYKAYRAMVRAKVTLFSQNHNDPIQCALALRQYRQYTTLAEDYCAIPNRFLAITHGVSAVGKSHVAMRLVDALGAIRLRSDVERKRLLCPDGICPDDLYSQDNSRLTYDRLHQLADAALQAGFSAVIDAAYLKQQERHAASSIAEHQGVPFIILDCHAPMPVIQTWLTKRQAQAQDPSDATWEIVEHQQRIREPLTAEEHRHSLTLQTNEAASIQGLIDRIRQRTTQR